MKRTYSVEKRHDNGDLYFANEIHESPKGKEITEIEFVLHQTPLVLDMPDRTIDAIKKLYRTKYVQNGNEMLRNNDESQFVADMIVEFINKKQITVVS